MQQGVTILKASAGSGKTYRLTKSYIDLLLDGDEQSYKHILAVTFTNKATDEMKSRVIEELHKLSLSGKPQADAARIRLRKLLHDYSCFSVSTIDKFFQTVMRSFAREIGQYASYRVELDTGAVLDQVVDRLLASLEDPDRDTLLKWLKDYTFDLVENGEDWNVAWPLKKMAGQFLNETFLLQMRKAGQGTGVLADKDELKTFLKKIDGIIKDYEKEAVAIGQEGIQLLAAYGFRPDSYYYGTGGPTMIFQKWASRMFERKMPSEKRIQAAVDKFPDPAALSQLFERVSDHLGEPLLLRNTAVLIRKNLYLLGIYGDLQRLLDEYLRENNVVLLQLSTDLLSRIIADDDAPFVYEKIGNRYDHLMLDEAQDTSLMQWHNFRPLFRNSQASGGCDLVVGDIKQSIYRWRGSDWRLMSEYLFNDLRSGLCHDGDGDPLDKNWRSGKAIVDFNNDIFLHLNEVLSADPDHAEIGAAVKPIYADCFQYLPEKRKNDPEGFVRLEFLEKESEDGTPWRETALQRMIDDINALRAEGYAYKEIGVLVRRNSEGAAVAATLMAKNINVITEDSLLIGSSPCISKLMSLLGWLVNPDDPVGELMVRDIRDKMPNLQQNSLYEICEQLLASDVLSHGEPDLPFIHAFLDAVLAFQEKYGSSLRAFVQWWDEAGCKKSICAPDGQNAVRVMTIHKAKGLSLDAVVIPFCSESFTPSAWRQPTIWCRCPAGLDGPPLIPLKASFALNDSLFRDDYLQERTLEHIDVINTWYVAFTRARTRLLAYAPMPSAAKGIKPICIENALYLHLAKSFTKTEEELVFRCFQAGSREPFVRKTESTSLIDDPQPVFTSVAMSSDRLKLSLRGEDYFAQEESARRQGIEKHRDMASVEIDDGLEAQSGNHHWFDGTYRVLNEASIVTESGEIYRPDRVLIAPDGSRVIVIDYKFGAPHFSHHRQVRNYVSLLQAMGYPAVEGWLWYVTAGEIVPA